MPYYTYILECADGSLYTGYTDDLDRRLKRHNSGVGSKFTRARLPVRLVYSEEYSSKDAAMRREWRIKQLRRKEKLALIAGKEGVGMKKILMIATGGTIASKPTDEGLKPAVSSEELLSYVPEIAQLCVVDTLQPFRLDSTNIHAEHWLELVRLVEQNYEKYDGFVITHGTDTMAYTAAALSYLIRDNAKPVVLTGSQKSVYLRDTDARRNLIDAFVYCVDAGASGVHIVFDGSVILGTRAKKTHSHSYNAFSSIDYPAVAAVRDGKTLYYIKERKPHPYPHFYHKLDDKVFVLKMIPGIRADIFDYLDARTDGLVIESFGMGGLPNYEDDAFFARLKKYTQAGKPVVITTQVEREGSALGTYEVGRRLASCKGVLEARCMTLEAAVTKLMWILAQTKEQKKISELFRAPVREDTF